MEEKYRVRKRKRKGRIKDVEGHIVREKREEERVLVFRR
jgi:hypothetical protein